MEKAGLYIHVPFCVRKCNYCDFLSFGINDMRKDGSAYRTLIDPYFEQLISEIRAVRSGTSQLYGLVPDVPVKFDSVYIGGGTPTAAGADNISRLLNAAAGAFELSADCEITVEANPGTVDINALERLKRAGVNRLSLGIQALRPGLLEVLGRVHSDSDARAAAYAARELFDSLNLDFILGIPGMGDTSAETLSDIEEIAGFIEAVHPDHVSAYSLITEPGTCFYEWQKQGRLDYPDEALERQMYHTFKKQLEALGYVHYEISNFALPGRFSRHNLKYWEGVPYLGLGAGAVSCLNTGNGNAVRLRAGDNLNSFTAYFPDETLDTAARKQEFMLLGFRKLKGPDGAQYRERFGPDADMAADFRTELASLSNRGLINPDNSLTSHGLDFANEIFMEFI